MALTKADKKWLLNFVKVLKGQDYTRSEIIIKAEKCGYTTSTVIRYLNAVESSVKNKNK